MHMTDTPGKRPLLSRICTHIADLAGISTGTDMFRQIPFWRSGFFASRWELFRNNCAQEETFVRLPFSEVLRAWGVHTDEERRAWIRQKRIEILIGILLFLFAFTAWSFAEKQYTLLSILSSLACLSVCALGLLIVLTGLWRMRCLQRQTFRPFLSWITRLGRL